jgi:DNA-binding SARP family transcriptional activator/predicted ATPase
MLQWNYMAELQFYLFGQFQVLRGGQPLTGKEWRSQQARAILKVLLTHYQSVVTTDQLLEILWPGEKPEISRPRLHVRVSQLRRALTPDPDSGLSAVLTVEGGYMFNPAFDIWMDTAVFEEQAEWGRRYQENGDLDDAISAYEAARTLYSGDYLVEDLYEDWAFPRREQLCERFLSVLTELAECYAQLGRYRRAIAVCQKALGADPFREAIYVRLMLYHYYAGEQGQALRVYDHCCQVLGEEFQVEPLPSTTAVFEQIRERMLWAVDGAPRYPPPAYEGRLFEVPYSLGYTPFVGREREYAWLVEQWRNRESGVLFLEGEAGVGKSRLVKEFLGYAVTEGATVLQSQAGLGRRLPYAPVIAALGTFSGLWEGEEVDVITLAALSPLFPTLAAGYPDLPALPKLPEPANRKRLYDAFETLVRVRLPPRSLLCFDDAHDLDAITIDLLLHLADVLPLVLVCRSEDTPPDHPLRVALGPLQRAGHVAALSIRRLTGNTVGRLIRQMAHDDLPHLSGQVYDQTDGNPLFVIATLQHMFEEGALYVDATGRWNATDEPVRSLPPSVSRTIEARLGRLSRSQRQVFDLFAVIHGDADFALLRGASRYGEANLLDALDGLIEAGVLVEPRLLGRGEFAPAHECYTEVAYKTLPEVRRRRLHHRVAEALEATTADLTRESPVLAYHFSRGNDHGRAFEYYLLAGDIAAARYAGVEAKAYYLQALDLPDLTRSQLVSAHERVGDVDYHALETTAAVQAYDTALSLWKAGGEADPVQGARLYRKIAELCTRWRGVHPEVSAYIEAGLALSSKGQDDHERVRLLVARAFDAFLERPQQAVAVAQESTQEALALAERLGAWDQVSQALDALAVIIRETEMDLPEIERLYRRRLEIVDRIEDPFERIDVYKMLGWMLYNDVNNYPEGIEYLKLALELAQEVDSIGSRLAIINLLTQAYLQWGRWSEVVEWAEGFLALVDRHAPSGIVVLRLATALAWLGREQEAESRLLEGTSLANGWRARQSFEYETGLFGYYIACGCWEAGQQWVEARPGGIDPKWDGTALTIPVAEFYVHLGEVTRAEDLLAGCSPPQSQLGKAQLNRVRGVLAHKQGDYPTSQVYLEAALDIQRRLDCRGEIICTLRDLAELYVSMGKGDAHQACQEEISRYLNEGRD